MTLDIGGSILNTLRNCEKFRDLGFSSILDTIFSRLDRRIENIIHLLLPWACLLSADFLYCVTWKWGDVVKRAKSSRWRPPWTFRVCCTWHSTCSGLLGHSPSLPLQHHAFINTITMINRVGIHKYRQVLFKMQLWSQVSHAECSWGNSNRKFGPRSLSGDSHDVDFSPLVLGAQVFLQLNLELLGASCQHLQLLTNLIQILKHLQL